MENKVSVIIPNYNHSPYLKQRIDSVLNQTYDAFEIIILDDQSTDESKDIIELYRNHPKVTHIIYNVKNSSNTFLQWKRGIELASCEWIWIAESDDYCEPSLLSELIEGSANDEDCVLAYCQSTMFRNNNILWVSGTNHLKEIKKGLIFINEHMLLGNSIFNASMCIFKKETYKNVSQEFTKYKFSGDWLFWIEIARQGSVYISGKNLNYFRKHDNDVSTIAFSSGLIYTEYFNLIFFFQNCGLIDQRKAEYLIREKYKQFLFDRSLSFESNHEISLQFKKRLGFTRFKLHIWVEIKKVYRYMDRNIRSLKSWR